MVDDDSTTRVDIDSLQERQDKRDKLSEAHLGLLKTESELHEEKIPSKVQGVEVFQEFFEENQTLLFVSVALILGFLMTRSG